MNKLFKYFSFAIVAIAPLAFQSCGDDNEEDVQPLDEIYEAGNTIAQNNDGTYISYASNMVRLHQADGKVIAKQEFNYPEPLNVDQGYGQIVSYNYYPLATTQTDTHVAIIFSCNTWLADANAYVVRFDRHLNSIETIPVALGIPHVLESGKVAMLATNCVLNVYDANFKHLYNSEKCKGVLNATYHSSVAVGELDAKYYALGSKLSNSSASDMKLIVDFSNGNTNEITLPKDEDIIKSFFSNEVNTPRIDSPEYSFSNRLFEVSYDCTLYSGDKKKVVYKYDVSGNLISSELR